MEVALNIVYVIVSVGLIITVLMQSAGEGGLSGALGGSSDTFFGKKKGWDELLAKFSTIFAISFMFLAFLLTILAS